MVSYQTVPYTHFHELIDTCTKHAQAIESHVKSLSEKARVIGTPSDTSETRARIDEDERRLHELASKTKTILTNLADVVRTRKHELSRDDYNKVTKIETAIKNATKNYQDAITNISKRRQEFKIPNNNALIDFENDNSDDNEFHRSLQLQKQIRDKNQLLVRENEEQFAIEEEIQQVQTDILEINHIMRDIGAIVAEQSPIIANVEVNIVTATDNIVAGNHQLTSAAGYQKKYRKKLCWLLIIFLIIAVIIAIILVVKLKG